MLLPNIKAQHPLTGELLPVLVSPNVNFGEFLDAIVGEVHDAFTYLHNETTHLPNINFSQGTNSVFQAFPVQMKNTNSLQNFTAYRT